MTSQAEIDGTLELIDAIDCWNREHHLPYLYGNYDYPPDVYYDAINDMHALAHKVSTHRRLRELLNYIDVLEEKTVEHRGRKQIEGSLAPQQSFWAAVNNVLHERSKITKPKLAPIPDVVELHRQGVGVEQISKMWPLTTIEVHEEIKNPGSKQTPEMKSIRDIEIDAEWGGLEDVPEPPADEPPQPKRRKKSRA
jgi:hypothetical protein